MPVTRLAAALLAGALLAPAAHAGEFTVFLYETPADAALRTDASAAGKDYWAAWGGYVGGLESAGVMRGGAPLVVEGTPLTPDGLVLGGYLRIEADDMTAAEALAASAPNALRGGRVDVRAVYDAPHMPPVSN